MKKHIAFLVMTVAVTASFLAAQVPAVVPMTENEVVDLLKGKVPSERIIAEVMERGVDFDLNPDIEKKLRKAKADDALIEAVTNQGPQARSERAKAGGGLHVTPEESNDFQIMRNELDPDRVVQMVNDFETKYPNSSLLTWVYMLAANACQQKGEIEQVVEYGDKSLKLKPDNLLSLIIMATMLPQPQLSRGGGIDQQRRLDQAEAYAEKALELIAKLPPQPAETEEQLETRRHQLSADPHSALGMVHLQRSSMALQAPDPDELALAAEEYEKAVSLTPSPSPQDYFRLGETYALLNKVDEAIQAFVRAGDLGQGTVIKSLADQKVEALEKRKAATAQ